MGAILRCKYVHKQYLLQASLLMLIFLTCSCGKDSGKEKEPEVALLQRGDVTTQLVVLGNPLSVRYKDNTPFVYARNVWDMHTFANKIYFGGGNSSNDAPAPNAGPADLWSFNPSTQSFVKEYTVNDEQIHRIREFDNELYIPGHDARESWDFGNFYRLEASGWKKYRTIPNAVHVYDIYKWGGKLFATIAPQSYASNSIQVSEDGGNTWRSALCNGTTSTPQKCSCYERIYTMFPLADELCALDWYPKIYSEKDGAFNTRPYSDFRLLFSDIQRGDRIERPLVFAGQTVYIAAYTYNDHQYLPLALMRAKDVSNVTHMNLPTEALPRDILVNGKWLLVLVSNKVDDNTYRNTVLATSDISTAPAEWTTLFHFTTETFARSFEYLNGTFYFGLGCETERLAPSTGNILSVSYKM